MLETMESIQGIEKLLHWYGENKRVLPWRGEPTPYETWVSEIMLQQTRVETVKAYYLRWMEAFPTVFALAEADEETVLKKWEGLGYYSRARNLYRAAKTVVEDYGGELPCDKKTLVKLPGIGEYTAGAILSIAFGKCEPAVDGNVLRVVSRLNADPFDIADNKTKTAVGDMLRPLMPKDRTSDFTQALFELGALVCLPDEDYRCGICPMTEYCKAFREKSQQDFPVMPVKAEKKREKKTVFVIRSGNEYVLKKRPEKGLLAGLYELPNVDGFMSEEEVKNRFGGKVTPLPNKTHVFTHIVWEMQGFLVETDEPIEDGFLAKREEIENVYSLPSAFSAYKKYCK